MYRLRTGERALITTAAHPELVDMVNHVKESVGNPPGGAFYINEFGQVLVPVVGDGTEYYVAGEYKRQLQFEFEGTVIGPEPPEGLEPGDSWPGPKVGIPYTLSADGRDVKFKAFTGPNRFLEKRLSDEVGRTEAGRLARRLARLKPGGGRIYINEARHFFAPVDVGGEWQFVYLGALGEDSWFSAPRSKRN